MDAAGAYVRVLVRVPEAYLLLHPFDAKLPGLLVTDADGRHVASVSLKGAAPIDVARALNDALEADATERFFLRANDEDADLTALVQALTKVEGVLSVDEEFDGVVAITKPGMLLPERLAALIEGAKADVRLAQPAVVQVAPARQDVDLQAALARVPGVWHAATTAWINRFLVHPDRLAAAGLTSNAVVHRLRFIRLPRGDDVVQHFGTPFEHEGVIAVVPDVAARTIEVIGRRGEFDPKPLEAAYSKAGLALRLPDTRR